MKKMMLSGKIHTARLTDCQIDYEGSLEIDPELLAEAEILPYEKILVSNRENGSRLETYAIPGEPGAQDNLWSFSFQANAHPARCRSGWQEKLRFADNG